MRLSLSHLTAGLENNDHIQGKSNLFVVELALINICAQIILERRFFQ
jgi:hypothetical protein